MKLLLNYIRTHLEKFYRNTHEIVQWFPVYCTTKRNAVLELVWIMENNMLDINSMKEVCVSLGQTNMINELGIEEGNGD